MLTTFFLSKETTQQKCLEKQVFQALPLVRTQLVEKKFHRRANRLKSPRFSLYNAVLLAGLKAGRADQLKLLFVFDQLAAKGRNSFIYC